MTNEHDYRMAKGDLLAAAMRLSPTGTEQQAFSANVNKARMDGATDKEVCIDLLSSMLDGLRHGNWPSVSEG
jgi:hypothetical protein